MLPPVDPLDSRQFQLAVKKLADSLNFGADKSPFLGSGQEYAQSRPYEPGDPIKAMDWRVTARTGKAYVKEYEAPKRMPVWLLIDTSASMAVSSAPLSKYAWAVRIAGGLALSSLDRASPVGVLTVGGRDLRLEPSLSRDRVMQWLHALRRHRITEPTTLSRRLAELAPALTGRCMLVVLSDLHDPGAVAALKLAAQRHETIVIQLTDPAEAPVRGAGFFRVREAESGREYLSQGREGQLDFDATAGALRRAGVDHLRLVTNGPVLAPLREFVKNRGASARTVR
ncbi:MAG: DUF58 domain-containing protein [Verrucomicrobiaceae bacterium]|nr:MAG: DUF58 domain-containing protein [Verrucomicrobiaceae bacterium]